MAIEGLNNVYGVPPVGKEHETGLNQKKKQDKNRKKGRREKDDDMQKKRKGRIDIRI